MRASSVPAMSGHTRNAVPPPTRASEVTREMMMSAWGGRRGNAKSAGTGDMPIPGEVISRRKPAPKKVPVPPTVSKKKLLAEAQAAARVAQRKAEKEQRARERGRRSRSRSRSKSSSSSSRRPSTNDQETPEQKRQREKREEEHRLKKEEEERQLRREAEERWRKQQGEQEARQREDRRAAEEQRLREDQRQAARKRNLAGAFAITGDADEDEETALASKRAKELELALQQKKATRDARKCASCRGTGKSFGASCDDCNGTGEELLASAAHGHELAGAGTSSSRSRSAPLEKPDPVNLRASFADPSASRSFSSGEVAQQYKLLQEMKRKFRSKDFGGPIEVRRSPSRSKKKKHSRSRSNSRSRYDSVWIRPTTKRTD